MFVVSTNDKKVYKEGTVLGLDKGGQQIYLTWDSIPSDAKISSLQLTYPFMVKLPNKSGKKMREYAPNLTISGFDRYYFSNEAVATMAVLGNKSTQVGPSELVAKIIAGIDDKLGTVLEIRMDKSGNVRVNRFALSDLNDRIKKGLFRETIIRKGIQF